MSKLTRSTVAAGLSVLALAAAATQTQASVVYMSLSDIHTPILGVAGFDGTSMVSLHGVDDFIFNNPPFAPLLFTNAHFEITSGFTVLTTLVADTNGTPGVNNGDPVTSTIGNMIGNLPALSTFDIVNGDGVLVHGSFSSAVLNTTIGSSTVNINSANVNGLDLTPGPVLLGLGYTDLAASESFALSITGINPGVTVATTAPIPGTPFYVGTMAPFGVGQATETSGTVNLVANLVPEPTSLGLVGLGAMAIASRRRRAIMKKLSVLALAIAGLGLFGTGSKAQAAVLYMNISDINPPIQGVAGYDGTNVVSLGGVDTFTITGLLSHAFADSTFTILTGFNVSNTVVADSDFSNSVSTGDTVTSSIGAGTFKMSNVADGDLVYGSFDGATLSTSIGSTAVTINSSNASGLDLTPGVGLMNLGIISLNPVESFALNIVGLTPGVSVSNAVQVVIPGTPPTPLPFFTADLNAFAIDQRPVTSGSVDMVADAQTPEPASLGLLGVAAAGMIARRRRA